MSDRVEEIVDRIGLGRDAIRPLVEALVDSQQALGEMHQAYGACKECLHLPHSAGCPLLAKIDKALGEPVSAEEGKR